MKTITLKVNSKKIPLNRFVAQFMTKTIEGMITSLRGVNQNDCKKIEITIEQFSDDKK